MEDFIPWVPLISNHPPYWEEEEEEDRMSDLIHNFAAQKRKRDDSFEQAVDAIPGVAGGSDQSRSDESSEVQEIVISGLPKIGLNDQPTPENITLAESRVAFSVPAAM